jgi:hypothetical protein
MNRPTNLPAGARFSEASWLALTLLGSDSVELTVNGILTAMSRLTLAVVPLAEPRFIWDLWDALTTPALPGAQEPVKPGVFGRAGVAAARRAVDRVRATRTLTAAGLAQKVVELEPVGRQAILAITASKRARVIDGIAAGVIPGIDIGRALAANSTVFAGTTYGRVKHCSTTSRRRPWHVPNCQERLCN